MKICEMPLHLCGGWMKVNYWLTGWENIEKKPYYSRSMIKEYQSKTQLYLYIQ
jgi:hypothetical protein